MLRFGFLILFALVVACGDDDGSADAGDTSEDSSVDGQSDAFTDVTDAGNDADDAPLDDVRDAPSDVAVDSPNDTPADAPPPGCDALGLYQLGSCTELAAGVEAYSVRYPLYSDDVDKARFLFLPSGATIDTSNPNDWVFPVGTRVYKTFIVDGRRIETRVFEKHLEGVGRANWNTTTYAWNSDETEVTEVRRGQMNAGGTSHDIPRRIDCFTCHATSARSDMLLGVSAIQLNHDNPGVTLASLNNEGRLSSSISLSSATIPGNTTESNALGYLHSNCGGCHGGPVPSFGFDTWVNIGLASPEETQTYITGVDQSAFRATPEMPLRIASGAPDSSVVVRRMSTRELGDAMPPLGSERVHDAGVMLIREWILSL